LKIVKLALPLLLAAASTQAGADNTLDCKQRTDAMNLITDVVVIRPVGFAVTLAGAAVFVGLSPLTALASIPDPQDAFNRVGAVLVGAPYGYTFVRPLGEFSNTCR
jgi:cytochrome c biogenesis protein CcdA